MQIEVSIGEVVDKYTILVIKEQHITDPIKLANVVREREYLESVLGDLNEFKGNVGRLIDTNQALWNIEDQIRIKESRKEFDAEFIDLARAVYVTNDVRAEIKREINLEQGSLFVEEKQYVEYKSNQL
jgi:hypothetical protein